MMGHAPFIFLQYLTPFIVKKFFLMSNPKLPSFSLKPMPNARCLVKKCFLSFYKPPL